MHDKRLLALLLTVLVAGGCKSTQQYFFGPDKTEDPAEVPAALERAAAEAEAGDLEQALEVALGTRAAQGLSPELRDQVERTIERYAAQRIDALEAEGTDPGALEDLMDFDLPRQLAVSAGITAARLRHEQGKYKKAFALIRELDTQYPQHHERAAAGVLLTEVGFALLVKPAKFFGWIGGPTDAIPVFEYLVLRYPSAPRCDEAYALLADLYLEDRDYRLARQRYEDLLLYHPDSDLAIEAAAQVPRLRMTALDSPEYDRRELVLALAELELWLDRHGDHELEPEVRLDYADCLLRLAESDFSIARFYAKLEQTTGAVLHGERALEFARRARDEELAARLEEFLRGLPPLPGEPLPPADTASADPVPNADAAASLAKGLD